MIRHPARASQAARRPQDHGGSAFTLVELLAVVAIIMVMASLLLGGLELAEARALRTQCASNLRHAYVMLNLYGTECDGYLPDFGTAYLEATYATPNGYCIGPNRGFWGGNCHNIVLMTQKVLLDKIAPGDAGALESLRCPKQRGASAVGYLPVFLTSHGGSSTS